MFIKCFLLFLHNIFITIPKMRSIKSTPCMVFLELQVKFFQTLGYALGMIKCARIISFALQISGNTSDRGLHHTSSSSEAGGSGSVMVDKVTNTKCTWCRQLSCWISGRTNEAKKRELPRTVRLSGSKDQC